MLVPTDAVSMPYFGVKFIKIKEKLDPKCFAAVWRRGDNQLIIASLLEHTKRQNSNDDSPLKPGQVNGVTIN